MTAVDWLKFAPGWLAFLWTLGIGTRKVWLRRHHLALGPGAEDLRTQLTTVRNLFHDVTTATRRAEWFLDPERKDVADRLRDSANRAQDTELRERVQLVAGSWGIIGALAPPSRSVPWWLDAEGDPTARTPEAAARDLEEIKRLQEMVRIATEAQSDVKAAMDRLNELERKTVGRS